MSFAALLLAAFVQAARPDLIGAELRPLGAVSELARDVTAVNGPAWVGYAVPAAAGAHRSCSGVFDLERDGGYTSDEHEDAAAAELYIFLRVAGGDASGDIRQVRSVTSGCRIRAGAAPVYWLSGVQTDDSVRFLMSVARGKSGSQGKEVSEAVEDAVHAIAWHRGTVADEQLDAFAGDGWPLEVREKAVFWMGAARGERGYRNLAALIDSVSERALREKIVFALHVSDADGATSTLIRVARQDHDSEVREKTLFWLGQEAGQRAADTIVGAVRDDPDIDVQEKAVFALSQLPPDEGVPLLVDVAQTHPQPEIRKKAFFWLAQSNDPRALTLIESVLLN